MLKTAYNEGINAALQRFKVAHQNFQPRLVPGDGTPMPPLVPMPGALPARSIQDALKHHGGRAIDAFKGLGTLGKGGVIAGGLGLGALGLHALRDDEPALPAQLRGMIG